MAIKSNKGMPALGAGIRPETVLLTGLIRDTKTDDILSNMLGPRGKEQLLKKAGVLPAIRGGPGSFRPAPDWLYQLMINYTKSLPKSTPMP